MFEVASTRLDAVIRGELDVLVFAKKAAAAAILDFSLAAMPGKMGVGEEETSESVVHV